MLRKLLSLLKDGDNLTIVAFLLYVVALTHLVGAFLISWCWKS